MKGAADGKAWEGRQKAAPAKKSPGAGGGGQPTEEEPPSLTRRGTPRLTTEERAAINRKNRQTHGLSYHPLYNHWKDMRRRVGYRREYVEHEIDMDPRWHDVTIFIEDIENTIGPRPEGRGWSIDRIDNDRGYYHWNLQWATAKMQANNRGHASKDCLLSTGEEARFLSCWGRPCEQCPWEEWK